MSLPTDSNSSDGDSDSKYEFVSPVPLPTLSPKKKKQLAAASPKRSSKRPSPVPESAPTKSTTNGGASFVGVEAGSSPQLSVSQKVKRRRGELSSLLTSVVLHTLLFIGLALWFVPNLQTEDSIGVVATILAPDPIDPPELVPAIEVSPVKIETLDVEVSPIEDNFDATNDNVEELAAEKIPTPIDSVRREESLDVLPTNDAPSPNRAFAPGGGPEGRDAESRAKLASKYGGSPGSETAVEDGLRWIVHHQASDGSWGFFHHHSECNGRCRNEGLKEAPTAATGLALMSLLGAGYTHQNGPYQSQVKSGLDYLDQKIKYLSYGGSLTSGRQPMYGHAIATAAMAEALAMTGDETYRKAVTEARRYIISSQHPRGGWRYTPQSPGDMSVTGWVVMALKACENAGIGTEPEQLDKTRRFIETLAFNDGTEFGYRLVGTSGKIEPASKTRRPSCTAIGHLTRLYLRSTPDLKTLDSGCDLLATAGPSNTDVYFDYYASLVLHHAKSEHWETWNKSLRDTLVRTQQKEGHEHGSWYFEDRHGQVGGRLYTTAMAVMTLEVYYRFLPLYETEVETAPVGTDSK